MCEVKAVLAEHEGLGRIHRCECNTVHTTFGPVTVALAPEALAQMSTMVRKAMEELSRVAGLTRDEGNLRSAFEPHGSRFTH
jgi:hypothetical protein